MISRFLFRPASAVARLSGALLVPLAFAGCGDVFSVGTLSYVASPDLKTKLGEKPDLQKNIREQLLTLFGADPQHIKVPKGSGLPGGGIYLASHQEAEPGKIVQIKQVKAGQGGVWGDQPGGGIRALSPPLRPLPRRLRRGTDRPPRSCSLGRAIIATVPISSPPRSPVGSRPSRTCERRLKTASTAPRCPPSRH